MDQGVDHSLSSNAFKQACETLWTDEIICDLIYDRGLQVCQLCMGFFNGSDQSANHPAEYCVKVVQLCSERRVVNASSFYKAMWFDAVKVANMYGKISFPRMDANHVDHQVAAQRQMESSNLWLTARVQLLEKHAQQLEVDKSKLLGDKRTLQMHFHKLLERTLQDKAMIETIKLKAETHLDALRGLLHPEAEEKTTDMITEVE